MSDSSNKLPAEVREALEAYRLMGITKTDYFAYLQELDQKYRQGGAPTIAENLQLEKLLEAHDEKVSAFNTAMQAVTETEARELLLQKLSEQSKPGMH